MQRFGTRLGWNGSKLPTLLVGPILDAQGHEICDHLWLRVGQRIALADPQPGDVLTLTGSVRPYTKRRKPVGPGSVVLERDLGLSYPTRCAVLKAPEPTAAPTPEPEPAKMEATPPPTDSVERSHRITVPACDIPARARILFAAAVLALEFPQGVSLSRLNRHAGVPPTTFISQLKKLGSAGIVQFTPTGRILLTTMPNQAAMGVAQ